MRIRMLSNSRVPADSQAFPKWSRTWLYMLGVIIVQIPNPAPSSGSMDCTVELSYRVGSEWRSIFALDVSPDGKKVATGDVKGMISILNATNGVTIHAFQAHKNMSVQSVVFSPDGGYLASGGGDGQVRLWNVESWIEEMTLSGHEGYIRALAFSPDGKILASGADDKTISLWNPTSGIEVNRLIGHDSPVTCLTFSADGDVLYSGGHDQTIRTWDVLSFTEKSVLNSNDGWVDHVELIPNTDLLVASYKSSPIILWNVERGSIEHRFELPGFPWDLESATSIGIAKKGQILILGLANGSMVLWDSQIRQVMCRKDKVHDSFIQHVAVAPNGDVFWTASSDGYLQCWSLK